MTVDHLGSMITSKLPTLAAMAAMRGFLESRDLLMSFRFDVQSIRNKIALWFEGNMAVSS